VEWQWTLGEIITAVAAAGLEIVHLGEYPEPFWRAGGVSAAAAASGGTSAVAWSRRSAS
jgi:hypothetical protein